MARQAPLFTLPSKPRVVRMHATDAGQADGAPHLVYFECARCDHDAGWVEVRTMTEGKRGLPCPVCNGEPA